MSGTSLGARRRAIESMVPSPPSTMARSMAPGSASSASVVVPSTPASDRGVGVDRNRVAAGEQEGGERGERRHRARPTVASDERDPGEAFRRAGGHPAIKP